MKILVTGAGGMLGQDLVSELKCAHEVAVFGSKELDIANFARVLETISAQRPDIVINCAAYAKVDDCETEVERAININTYAVENLAKACVENGVNLAHISTDYVFDGKKGSPYTEDDCPNPLSVYGRSKLEGEEKIRHNMDNFYIVRTQWLFGRNGKNFVSAILESARGNRELKVVDDQFGSPTYTKDLSKAIAQLITTRKFGTYHLTNMGIISWYKFAQAILEISELEDVRLTPCTSEEFSRPAVRPTYSPLENRNWRELGFEQLRSYKEALSDFVKSF